MGYDGLQWVIMGYNGFRWVPMGYDGLYLYYGGVVRKCVNRNQSKIL